MDSSFRGALDRAPEALIDSAEGVVNLLNWVSNDLVTAGVLTTLPLPPPPPRANGFRGSSRPTTGNFPPPADALLRLESNNAELCVRRW